MRKIEKIKEEIERLDEEYRTLRVEGTTQQAKEADLVVHVLLQISNFIDSLLEESGCEVNFTTKSDDLEREIGRYTTNCLLGKRNHSTGVYHLTQRNCDDIARHFTEWQKQKDEELFSEDTWNYIEENYSNITEEEKLKLYDVSIKSRLAGANTIKQHMKEALQTEYEKGRFDMREELIKNTVLETKVMMDCDGDGIETPYEEWLTLENTEIPSLPDNLGLKEGDRVKIIIVKEEQQ